MSLSLVSPAPPVAGEALPHIGAGLRFVESPTRYLKELRDRHGDTFLLDVFGFQLLFTFSPEGLESLYQLEEDKASFGLATFDMIGFKTPLEVLMDADIHLFYELLTHKNMPRYLDVINRVVDLELERWGSEGNIDLFDAVRTLEQRVGYGLWISDEATDDHYWPQLKRHFDVLDQERAFVDPGEILATIKTDKAKEREAVGALGRLIGELMDLREHADGDGVATLDVLRARFSDFSATEQRRRVIHNAINANQGFLSNLYAAIAWVVTNLEYHPQTKSKVLEEIAATREKFGEDFLSNADALNTMTYLEQVMMESIRLAQRSLTLRKVMEAIPFNDGCTEFTVQPGVYIATMLSVTNTQTEELARFDPEHYDKNKLVPSLATHGKHSISTFGHGKHSCPAQRFSHHMCKIVVTKMLDRLRFEVPATQPVPSDKQMGGVSRPANDFRVIFSQQ